MTTITLHKNVKVLASTYSAIALTMAMEEAMGGAPHPINWDDMDAVKADIEARRKQLHDAKFVCRGVEGENAFFDIDEEDVLRYRDNFELVKAANTDEMQGPLTLAPLHDMMDEYYNRIMGNETIKAIIARGNVKEDGRAHFEECKAKIANV